MTSKESDVSEERRRRRAYRQWQSSSLNLGAEPEVYELIRAAFDGGWKARNKLIQRLIRDADEEKERADLATLYPPRNPCDEIFSHKWLDPVCVGGGCQSLLLKHAVDVLKRLVVTARTSGGTAGADSGLMIACDEAETFLVAHRDAALSSLSPLEDRLDVPSPSAPAAPCPSPEMGEG